MIVRLEDVCVKGTSNIRQKDVNESGRYPVYGAGGPVGFMNSFQYGEPYVGVVKDGAGIGRATYLPSNSSIIGTMQALIPKNNVLPKYLYYAVSSMHLEKYYSGATIPHIYFKNYKHERFILVSKKEQEKIIWKFSLLEKILSNKQQQLLKLDELIKARFVEMFGDPNISEKNQKKVSMTDVCQIIDGDRGKNYPHANDFYNDGYCLFLNAKNVTTSGFDFSNKMYISKEKDEALKKGKLNRGDLVLTTRGTIGNLAFYSSNIPFYNIRINSGMVILRLNHDKIEERFFIEHFKLQLLRIKQKVASGTAQPQLPISTMNKIKIFLPPLSLQNEFANFVQQVDKSKFENIVYLNKTLSSKILSQLGDAIRD